MLKKWTCKEKKWSRFLVWILMGFLMGAAFASLFFSMGKESFLNMEEQMWNTIKSIRTVEISYIINEVIVQGKEILILFIIVMSSWYDVLLFLFWLRKGFLFGIFMGMLAKCHGFYGILLGICYIFPKEYIYTLLEYGIVIALLNTKYKGAGRKKANMLARGMKGVTFVGGIMAVLIIGALSELVIGFKILSQFALCLCHL